MNNEPTRPSQDSPDRPTWQERSEADLTYQRARAGPVHRFLLGTYLILLSTALLIALLGIWPAVDVSSPKLDTTSVDAAKGQPASTAAKPVDPKEAQGEPLKTPVRVLGFPVQVQRDMALLVAVALLGAMGACLHSLSSFAAFVGNRKLVRSWLWWYLARAPLGALVATIIYYLLRGGLFSPSESGKSMNPYGVAALAALAGLSSETATEKFQKMFEALFGPREERKDAIVLDRPPSIASADPATLPTGATNAVEVILKGDSFLKDDEVLIESEKVSVVFVSETEMKIQVPAKFLAQPGKLALKVRRSKDPERVSDPFELEVKAP